MHKAKLFKKLAGKKVKCTACKHYCEIPPGRCGICGVRQNVDGELFSLVYGRPASTAVGIDPIEKKPLFHFSPGSEVFSIGTLGCNFACSFCQNWDISQGSKNIDDVLEIINKTSYDLPPGKIVQYCKKEGIPSIAYTYNEPTVFFEYTYDTAVQAHKEGIKNIYVSNGYTSKEALDKIAPYLDAANIDLKAFTDKFYQKVCRGRLKPVLETIEHYVKKKIWIEITTLIIPDQNDSDSELKNIAEFLAELDKDIPWHISKFTPQYKMQDAVPTPDEKLMRAYEIGREAGLNFVYTGNIFSKDTQSTYCPQCNELLIERDWGYSKVKALKSGKCSNCGLIIRGVWA